jgi:hypothetical protein
MDACSAAEDESSGPVVIIFHLGSLFKPTKSCFAPEPSQARDIDLNNEKGCRVVAETGASRWIGQGRTWLETDSFWGYIPPPFDCPVKAISFINPLRGNAYLELLLTSRPFLRRGIPLPLAAALLENKGMTRLDPTIVVI